MFSISVCYSDSALGLKISLDCMGECMVVDIYEDAFNAIVVNYHRFRDKVLFPRQLEKYQVTSQVWNAVRCL